MNYPNIMYKGKKLYQVGCRNCGQGNNWKIYSDGENFAAICGDCRHDVEIINKSLVDKPDRS